MMSASSGPWRDGCENWGKEKGNENAISVKMAVRPVLPPSKIPTPLSIYAVTGGDPKNGNQKDSHGDGALGSVHHEQNGEQSSREDSNPHGRISHLLSIGTKAIFVPEFRSTSSQFDRRAGLTSNGTNTGTVSEAH
jgi:hypothetical protein